MDRKIWLFAAILIFAVILVLLIVFMARKKKSPPDYYALFIIGLMWTVLGLPLKNYALSAAGVVFVIVGLANKNKWKKHEEDWSKLNRPEKIVRIITMAILGLLVVLGIVFYFLTKKGII